MTSVRRVRAAAGGDRLDGRRGRAGRDARSWRPGRCATRARRRWRGSCAEAGGEPVLRGIVPDDAARLEAVLGRLRRGGRLSSWSPRAPRWARATSPRPSRRGSARSSATGSRCGRGSRRCWPTAAACRCRAAGQPALGARRVPAGRRAARAGGRRASPRRRRSRRCAPGSRATSRARRGGSTSSRRRCAGGVATPLFGSSALLGPMVARGRLVRGSRGRHRARRRAPRSRSELYGMRTVPGTSARVARDAARRPSSCTTCPPAEALAAWLGALEGRRLEAVEVPLDRGARARDRRAGVGAALLARLRRGRDGRDRRARGGHARRDGDGAACRCPDFAVVDTGDALPEGFDAVVMREHVHWDGRACRRCAPRSRRGSTCARSGRTSARPSCCCPRVTGCGRSTSPPRRPRATRAHGAPRAARARDPDRGRGPPGRRGAGARRAGRHELAHARRAGARGGLRGATRRRSCPTTRSGSRRRCGRRRRAPTS